MAGKNKRRAGILLAEAVGFMLAGGAFFGGAAYAMSHSHLALAIGAALGIGGGLILAMDGES